MYVCTFCFAGITIGFEQDVYNVNETDGAVMINVILVSGMIESPVQVNFSTSDGSATSVAPEDFTAVSNLVLTFDQSTTSVPITISIEDDMILENTENFFGNLATSAVAVTLFPPRTTINILEVPGDDGKWCI